MAEESKKIEILIKKVKGEDKKSSDDEKENSDDEKKKKVLRITIFSLSRIGCNKTERKSCPRSRDKLCQIFRLKVNSVLRT